MRRLMLLVAVAMTVAILGCSASHLQPQQKQKIQVFFFYSPYCPHCQEVKPYMRLLREKLGREVEFHFCNVAKWNCSPESLEIAKKYPFEWIPTVIVIANGKVYKLTGTTQVLKLGEILKKYGINPPPVVFENKTYSVEECIGCHEERNIPPPTNFTCDHCCHRSSPPR